jgi:hypothetical protein
VLRQLFAGDRSNLGTYHGLSDALSDASGEHLRGDRRARRRIFTQAERVQELVDHDQFYVRRILHKRVRKRSAADVDHAAARCGERERMHLQTGERLVS